MRRPDEVVAFAAALRREHYEAMGARPLRWDQLTDAQKLPWLIRATG